MEYEKIVKPVVLEWAKEERVSGASIMLLIKDLCATLEAVEHSMEPTCSTCGGKLVAGKCFNLNCVAFV